MAIALWSLFLVGAVSAQNLKKVGQTGLAFLSVDVAARPAAMGGAFVLAGKGADAMFYNPAGMMEMDTKADVLASRTEWIADIAISSLGAVIDFGEWGTFGVSAVIADYGTSIGTRVANNPQGFVETGNLDWGAVAIGLSYGRKLSDKFMVGGQAKFAHESLGSNETPNGKIDNSVSGVAFDIGTIFYPGFKSFRFGMSARNFSPQFKYEEDAFELPLTFRIGVAMDVLDFMGGSEKNSFLVGIDALHPRDYSERLHIGGEYWYQNFIALRAGYKTNYDEEGISLGAGLRQKVGGMVLKIDYAYTDLGVFSNVNRFTIGASF
jgi:hypothetical protein